VLLLLFNYISTTGFLAAINICKCGVKSNI
jgi:hypothetical protein